MTKMIFLWKRPKAIAMWYQAVVFPTPPFSLMNPTTVAIKELPSRYRTYSCSCS